MKYYGSDRHNAPVCKPIWGLAYDINDDTEHKRLICKPVLGEIVGHNFYQYKKGTTEKRKSGRVSYWARIYADTYEEAVDMYNELVQKRIDNLLRMIDLAESDMIGRRRDWIERRRDDIGEDRGVQ